MQNYYDRYKHLLGTPYDDGDHDCYGLCIRYYKDCYGIELPNYARSADFFHDGPDIVSAFVEEQDFVVVDVPLSRLEVGDGLFFAVPNPATGQRGTTNHIGVFVGNHTFLHHLYGRKSTDDALDGKWKKRITAVLRHPEVTLKNREQRQAEAVDVLSLIPDHVKQKHGIKVA